MVTVTLPASVEVGATRTGLGTASEAGNASQGRRVVWEMDRVSARSQNELSLVLKPTENRPFELLVDWMVRPHPSRVALRSNSRFWRWRLTARAKCGSATRRCSRCG